MTLRLATFTCAALAALTFIAGAQPAPKPGPAKPAAKVIDVEAGPLFDQKEASAKCPGVCKAPTKWNGTWRTTKPGVMSVCGCAEPPPPPPPTTPPPPPTGQPGTTTTVTTVTTVTTTTTSAPPPPPRQPPDPSATALVVVKGKVHDVEAGPLFDQKEAAEKCPSKCSAPATWNGQWRTTKPAIMSVCACEDPPLTVPANRIRSVDTGKIKDAGDAKKKCTKACAAPTEWTGEWRSKGKKAASCDCLLPPPPPAPPHHRH